MHVTQDNIYKLVFPHYVIITIIIIFVHLTVLSLFHALERMSFLLS
jgi:hypothetical protein